MMLADYLLELFRIEEEMAQRKTVVTLYRHEMCLGIIHSILEGEDAPSA